MSVKKFSFFLSLLFYCSANNNAVCEDDRMIPPDISYVSHFCFVRIVGDLDFFSNLPCYDVSILNYLI